MFLHNEISYTYRVTSNNITEELMEADIKDFKKGVMIQTLSYNDNDNDNDVSAYFK